MFHCVYFGWAGSRTLGVNQGTWPYSTAQVKENSSLFLPMMGLRKITCRQASHLTIHVSFMVGTAAHLVNEAEVSHEPSLHLKVTGTHFYFLLPSGTVPGHV